MTFRIFRVALCTGILIALLPGFAGAFDGAGESRRMALAKDLIADEQWTRAIEELRAAVNDPKEPAKAEALFWLAHSLNQENDFAAAVETIRQLERHHQASPWVKPARSLLIELAQKLRRDDVLWWAVRPSPRPRTAVAVPRTPPPSRRPAPVSPRTPEAVQPQPEATSTPPPTPAPAPPPTAWVVENWRPDADQRILALSRLLHSDAQKVIPMLRKIAMEEDNLSAARRAVFVLAESRKPEALSIVVEVAKKGPDPVRVAAVRGLGHFGGPEVSNALLQVYSSGDPAVKYQIVTTLGNRGEGSALLRIAQSEADRGLRAKAIMALGRAGGRSQLSTLYSKVDAESKRAIIRGLFTARGEDELIGIADKESDKSLRTEVIRNLRLLGTPKARAYVAKTTR